MPPCAVADKAQILGGFPDSLGWLAWTTVTDAPSSPWLRRASLSPTGRRGEPHASSFTTSDHAGDMWSLGAQIPGAGSRPSATAQGRADTLPGATGTWRHPRCPSLRGLLTGDLGLGGRNVPDTPGGIGTGVVIVRALPLAGLADPHRGGAGLDPHLGRGLFCSASISALHSLWPLSPSLASGQWALSPRRPVASSSVGAAITYF